MDNIDDLYQQALVRQNIADLVPQMRASEQAIYRNMFRLGYESHNAPTKPLAALLRAPQ